jgi:hypothetical protein
LQDQRLNGPYSPFRLRQASRFTPFPPDDKAHGTRLTHNKRIKGVTDYCSLITVHGNKPCATSVIDIKRRELLPALNVFTTE